MDETVRRRTSFDADWLFFKGDAAGAQDAAFDDADWRRLNLPHDWSIEGPFSQDHPAGWGGAYLPAGVGWYRKRFRLTEQERDKKVFVAFDGVYKNSDVWINGHHLGFHPYGYTTFHYDLTPHLLNDGDAENVLAVRVDNSTKPDARWYTGSGIYRHVWLLATDALHIAHWDTCVTTPAVSQDLAWVVIRTRIVNEGATDKAPALRATIFDADGNVVGIDEGGKPSSTSHPHPIRAGAEHEVIQRIRVERPRLWSVEDPYLYRVRSELLDGDAVVDDHVTPFGIRTIRFDADQGFLLNGQRVKINGVCLHHNGGCLGAAVPERVWERRLELLKGMGCNGVRTSHYPPAPEFLDLCDRMGFLVMEEAFDEWEEGKEPYGYHDYFAEWAMEDLQGMLHRDRNHPCVVLWSVGNEIREQTRPEGVTTLKRLVDVVHREDPTRPVTAACDNIAAPLPTTEPFLALLDVVGYNYVDRWGARAERYYAIDRQRYPQRRMVGSENVSVGGVRGAYDLEGGGGWWQRPYHTAMLHAELLWKFTRAHDYVAGDFMWTGIDYLGEARWPHKNSSSGVLDLCGFPKDGYYFYQSQWTDEPMLHLFPHWTWPGREGEVIPVICYTNCDSVELFVNGKSWGVKSFAFAHYGFDQSKGWAEQRFVPPARATTADLHLAWDVVYQPGTLRAVGNKDGEVVCVQEIVTAGESARIELTADREVIAADGRDVVHLTARILDAAGTLVPAADGLIAFEVEGEGRIIGVDNGDPASHEPFQADQRRAFNGLCLAIVQATTTPGAIQVTASAAGMAAGSVAVQVR